MSIQSAPALSHSGIPNEKIVRSTHYFSFPDDLTETTGSSSNEVGSLSPVEAHEQQAEMKNTFKAVSQSFQNKYLTSCMLPTSIPHRAEEPLVSNWIVSHDASSTVLSDISLESGYSSGDDSKVDVWDLRDHPSAVDGYCKHSWTIEVYGRDHLAGDTVWFRAFKNGIAGYRECEDCEILDYIDLTIKSDPRSCFYVKTTSNDQDSISFFSSDLILHALHAILRRAEYEDGIVLPTKTGGSRKRVSKGENKEKKSFLSWLFRFSSDV
ncbi:hypothetical protein FisN_36Lu054 [Fistulifera solaris]|uniref:Uncharacterized protein n=1 Tax=Fistulifera solaris TaxID=1519565 RepID=A0A1Z5JHJ1_FISSO|nr:hypothetical protein FisN_36Lu054 [Fistulifera solaris]|eukprot:GAX13473.1 hypothetical protein FisN_36Lu054 [Fistulifera solaris]